jgi:hypothetical protein
VTDDEIIAYGQAAQRLLDSPDFLSAVSYISGVHLGALLATADHEMEARERHFGHIRTLERTLGELKVRAHQARELLERLEQVAGEAPNDHLDPHSNGPEIP